MKHELKEISQTEFDELVNQHQLWLMDRGGKKLDLSDCQLIGIKAKGRDLKGVHFWNSALLRCDFSEAVLAGCNFSRASISHSKFNCADLTSAVFGGAVLVRSNFHQACLDRVSLEGASVESCRFVQAKLRNAVLGSTVLDKGDFSFAWLDRVTTKEVSLFSDCNLSFVKFYTASLTECVFRGCDLTQANFRFAVLAKTEFDSVTLSRADFSGAMGILSPIEFLEQFPSDADGVLVFKVFDEFYQKPEGWLIESGSTITETVNPDRSTACGSGVHFGTLDWIEKNTLSSTERRARNITVWVCRIPWRYLSGVVVPFNTDGKARCERLELVANMSLAEARKQFKEAK